jgi:hypothetical protein
MFVLIKLPYHGLESLDIETVCSPWPCLYSYEYDICTVTILMCLAVITGDPEHKDMSREAQEDEQSLTSEANRVDTQCRRATSI